MAGPGGKGLCMCDAGLTVSAEALLSAGPVGDSPCREAQAAWAKRLSFSVFGREHGWTEQMLLF